MILIVLGCGPDPIPDPESVNLVAPNSGNLVLPRQE